jgi:hypothetical protein
VGIATASEPLDAIEEGGLTPVVDQQRLESLHVGADRRARAREAHVGREDQTRVVTAVTSLLLGQSGEVGDVVGEQRTRFGSASVQQFLVVESVPPAFVDGDDDPRTDLRPSCPRPLRIAPDTHATQGFGEDDRVTGGGERHLLA